jgi:hypothetical protein
MTRVEVCPDVETLHTSVSRDVWDSYYEVPEHLVIAVEEAQATLDATVSALTSYIDDNDAPLQYVEG